MKFLLSIALIFAFSFSQGQNTEHIKANIEAEVSRILKLSTLAKVSFRIQALKKVLHYISYDYITENKRYVRVARQFSYKNDTVKQCFYLRNDQLIYANETIVSYHTDHDKTDSIAWSGDFYFSKGKLIDYATLGHGKSEPESWDPEQSILAAFKDSKRDLNRFIKKKTGG